MGEMANAFAHAAKLLQNAEQKVEYDETLLDMERQLGILVHSLDELNETNEAQLKESRLQFAMRYTAETAHKFNDACNSVTHHIDASYVEGVLWSFRKNWAHLLPAAWDEQARNVFVVLLHEILGHEPTMEAVQEGDHAGRYSVRYD